MPWAGCHESVGEPQASAQDHRQRLRPVYAAGLRQQAEPARQDNGER